MNIYFTKLFLITKHITEYFNKKNPFIFHNLLWLVKLLNTIDKEFKIKQ